jgi:hypothetical protein
MFPDMGMMIGDAPNDRGSGKSISTEYTSAARPLRPRPLSSTVAAAGSVRRSEQGQASAGQSSDG